ncbi:MAG TPA: histidine kinase [Polyangiaceae bacterium]
MLGAYLRGDCEEVLRIAALVEADRRFLGSNPILGAFHGTLAVMSSSRVRRPFRGRLAARHVKRLRQLSGIFRQNFRPFTLLADGEWAWSRRQSTNALRLLKEAVADSVEHGNDLTHALACECLAAHYEELGDSAQHREFLSRAAYGFGRFGAHAKLRRMTEMHPGIGPITRSVQDASTGESVEARLSGVLRSIDAIADERRVEKLAQRLLQILTSSAGSQRGVLARNDEGTWRMLAAVGYDGPGFDPGAALEEAPCVPQSIVRYALRTQSSLYLDRPAEDPRFGQDAYFVSSSPFGVVCLPIPHRGRASILVYLENNLSAPAFDANLKRVIEIIGRQTAVSLATADHHKVQMDALQARINPHFLYNTLSTIAELVIKDPTAAESALVVLARLYRYMLASSWDQVVSLRQELDITRDYLAIEKHRFGERLDSRIEVVGIIDDVNVPALLLQPIAENAVRHGIAKKARPGRVQIYVYREQNSCKVRISDDGPGLDPSKPSSDGFGFGLRSVVQRLDLLYGNKYRMSTSSDAGYTVELQFPVSTGSA